MEKNVGKFIEFLNIEECGYRLRVIIVFSVWKFFWVMNN